MLASNDALSTCAFETQRQPEGNPPALQIVPKTTAQVKEIFEVPCQPLVLEKKLGAGAFGTVFRGHTPSERVVAIKQVVQDLSSADREAEICKMLAAGSHPNIVEVKGIYFEVDTRGRIMNLVLEYVPKTMRSVLRFLSERNMRMKAMHVQIYMYQLARALLFLHQHDIVHRDIKPENILINPETRELKLADFGSAKKIVAKATNTTYICTRFYRAPELILDRELYGPAIDIWSYGCILAEIAVGGPFFTGKDNVSQLVAIIRVLGSPTSEDIAAMATESGSHPFPLFCSRPRPRQPWAQVLTANVIRGGTVKTSFGVVYERLLDGLLGWRPSNRFTAQEVLGHTFFCELKVQSGESERLPPKLFHYTNEELSAIWG
jgi:glycogen synthase kinase 3 beta